MHPGSTAVPVRLHHVLPRWRGMAAAGDVTLLERGIRIGIVGSRRPREDTRELASRIAREAGRAGCTIVSGLAIGIDAAAHEAALSVGAPTIAVLPSGLGEIYPSSHRALAARIAAQPACARTRQLSACHDGAAPGLVVSEYGAGDVGAHRHQFQERNRIIAALSDYVVVAQAHLASGSMGTARHALELGVPLGVIPSGIDDPGYAGSIALIRDGADAVVDGMSLYRRLELHGVLHPGFAAAATHGARIDPERRGAWIGGTEPVQTAMLVDHPLASLLDVPRTPEELAGLTGLELRDVRRMLVELEDEAAAAIASDGTWTIVDHVRPAGSVV
ncbi:MAG: dprA [Thermoleophilia bacterium]|nr:dprA [Thermoleophilia bacterium]